MKNLTLQMANSTPFKKTAEINHKNNHTASLAAPQSDNAFQKLLNKQVQEQYAPPQEARAKSSPPAASDVNVPSVDSAASVESVVAADVDLLATKAEVVEGAHQLAQSGSLPLVAEAKAGELKADEMTDAQPLRPALAASDKISILGFASKPKKEKADVRDDKNITAVVDNRYVAEAAAINALLLPALTPAVANAQSAPPAAAQNVDKNAASALLINDKKSDVSAEVERNIFNSAEAQSKVTPQLMSDKAPSLEDAKSNEKWLQSELSGGSKQSIGDVLAHTKEAASAAQEGLSKELKIKTSDIQELSLQAQVQAAVKSNPVDAAQALGRSNMIEASPGKPGWNQEIGQKVVWMLGAKEQSATLTLNPPDLGPLQVVIHVHNDQANATFTSDNAEVRQALQDGMAHLREKMNELGIQLGRADVNSGEQMQRQFQQASQQKGALSRQADVGKLSADDDEALVRKSPIRELSGLVNTFA